ncbi:MAG: hypothetical protein KAS78_03460 [Candidatus Pacebacteria bacterium]|nr:hypothetical protein [Candidatus Paceibacterota bacterium]
MSLKNVKYYIGIIVFSFSISISAKAMNLYYFNKDIVAIFIDATKVLLSYSGRLALLFIIFGGVYYIFSGSNPENQEKAKKIITFAILGLILILSSYALLIALDRIGVS